MEEQVFKQMIAAEAGKGNKLKALLFDNTARHIFYTGEEFDAGEMIEYGCFKTTVYDMYKIPSTSYKPLDTIQGIFFVSEEDFDTVDVHYLFRS